MCSSDLVAHSDWRLSAVAQSDGLEQARKSTVAHSDWELRRNTVAHSDWEPLGRKETAAPSSRHIQATDSEEDQFEDAAAEDMEYVLKQKHQRSRRTPLGHYGLRGEGTVTQIKGVGPEPSTKHALHSSQQVWKEPLRTTHTTPQYTREGDEPQHVYDSDTQRSYATDSSGDADTYELTGYVRGLVARDPLLYFANKRNFPHFTQFLDFALPIYEQRYMRENTTLIEEYDNLLEQCAKADLDLTTHLPGEQGAGELSMQELLWALNSLLGKEGPKKVDVVNPRWSGLVNKIGRAHV